MQAMTLRLPDDVHEALRREAFESRRSMNRIILQALYALDFVNGDGIKDALNEAWESGYSYRDGSK